MTEFWLISAPGEKTCQQTWEKLHAATTKNNNLSTNSKFNIPDLKVGKLPITCRRYLCFVVRLLFFPKTVGDEYLEPL